MFLLYYVVSYLYYWYISLNKNISNVNDHENQKYWFAWYKIQVLQVFNNIDLFLDKNCFVHFQWTFVKITFH